MSEKVREIRLRRMAQRQGYRLVKTRRRDPRAIDYGAYTIVDPRTNFAVFGIGASGYPIADLDDIEEFLTGER